MMHFIEGVRDGGRKRPFNPAADMPKLTQAVQSLKDVRLIVLDPVAVTVTGDSHKNVETRVGLQPFADLCAQTGACGLGVHHFTKNTAGGNPLDRVTGSLAFHALPRCVLVAARDQNGGQNARRALMRAKEQRSRLGRFRLHAGPTPARRLPGHRSAARHVGRRNRRLGARHPRPVRKQARRHAVMPELLSFTRPRCACGVNELGSSAHRAADPVRQARLGDLERRVRHVAAPRPEAGAEARRADRDRAAPRRRRAKHRRKGNHHPGDRLAQGERRRRFHGSRPVAEEGAHPEVSRVLQARLWIEALDACGKDMSPRAGMPQVKAVDREIVRAEFLKLSGQKPQGQGNGVPALRDRRGGPFDRRPPRHRGGRKRKRRLLAA